LGEVSFHIVGLSRFCAGLRCFAVGRRGSVGSDRALSLFPSGG
jgi:hypothetical protein